jgi:hypothetical protein
MRLLCLTLAFALTWTVLIPALADAHESTMLFHAGTNVIGGFLPTPADVLGGFGDDMVLGGLAYWIFAIVLVAATQGTLGWDSKRVHPAKARQRRVAPG